MKSLFPKTRKLRCASWGSLVCLAGCLALSACSGSGDQSATNSQPTKAPVQTSSLKSLYDPCVLFSKDDASQLLGGAAKVLPSFSGPLCTYRNATPTDTKALFVSVGSSDDARGYFAMDRAQGKKDGSGQDLSGIGDAAFTVKLETGHSIIVLKDQTVYSITLIGSPLAADAQQSALTKLANTAAKTLATTTPTLPVTQSGACKLVTVQEANQTFQDTTTKWLQMANSAGVQECDYGTGASSPQRLQLFLTTNGDLTTQYFSATKKNLEKPVDLKGIGDEAYSDGGQNIWVRKGQSYFHLSVLDPDVDESQLEQLARTAVTRL
ncbi:DUF3558 family protein [Tengunoibacter tsumagoiensis]|uniref:DUF4367 domain-containing protein n=1 Tax=Tengunoibacter tsumagoiensis TaxID=2014871 RepID=A0A402A3E1_9CHLR|nr:DUF3558 family protein [Tengunoibacter tsumagoiensis]GCE13663.1 hypothetical protein KTT_35220 [Tengunoibacter tsumagoiensis]